MQMAMRRAYWSQPEETLQMVDQDLVVREVLDWKKLLLVVWRFISWVLAFFSV